MISTLRHHLAVSFAYARLMAQAQLEFPLFLVTWILMIPFQWLAGALLLKVLVQRFNLLGGWSFGQLLFLYGLGLLSHGITVTLFVRTWSIGDFVVTGEFDRLLTRPLNVYFHFLFSDFNLIGLLDLIPGVAIFLYGCREVGFAWTFTNLLALALVLAGAVLIRVAIYTATGSIAFWTLRSRSLLGLTLHLMERTTLYPLSFYPYWLQMALTWVLPLGFVSFYPACNFLGLDSRSSLPLDLVLWSPIAGSIAFALSYRLFLRGLAHSDSSGS